MNSFELPLKSESHKLSFPLLSLFLFCFLIVTGLLFAWLWERSSHEVSRELLADYEMELGDTVKELRLVQKRNRDLEQTLVETHTQLDAFREAKEELEKNFQELESRFQGLKQRFMRVWERSQADRNFHSGWHRQEVRPRIYSQPQNSTSQEIRRVVSETPLPKSSTSNSEIRGLVIKVNPVYQFAIVNVGREQGLREGDDLYVLREEIPLDGKLRVDRLYDTLAACSILFEDPALALRPGDSVIRR